MKNLNCKNCGAAMMFDSSAMTASCRFCGTKYVLSREDTDYFNDFYSTLSGLLGAGKNEEERKKERKRSGKWQRKRSLNVLTEQRSG